jgi:hypothetical protein
MNANRTDRKLKEAARQFGQAIGEKVAREVLKERLLTIVETAYRGAGHPHGDNTAGLAKWLADLVQPQAKPQGKSGSSERGH